MIIVLYLIHDRISGPDCSILATVFSSVNSLPGCQVIRIFILRFFIKKNVLLHFLSKKINNLKEYPSPTFFVNKDFKKRQLRNLFLSDYDSQLSFTNFFP
jgi:hypothetical protein